MRIEYSAEILEAQPYELHLCVIQILISMDFVIKNNCNYITYKTPYNILITCLCNFTSPVIHLLCHLSGIAFPSDMKTWPKGCTTLLRQTNLNKRLLFILPSPLERLVVKTLCTACSDDGQTVVLCTRKDI